MPDRTGLPAIVADAGAGDGIDLDDAEQLALLDLGLAPPKQARGRPAGRRNLRNQRVADYLLAKYRDPLEGLVQMASLGVEDLRAALNCSLLEAWQEKRLCAIAALPYLHQRQAIAVDVSNRNIVHLTINAGSGEAAPGAAAGETFILGQIVENQQVSEDEPDAV